MNAQKIARVAMGAVGLAVALLSVSCQQEQPRYGVPIVINGKLCYGLEPKVMYKGKYMYVSQARKLAAAEAASARAGASNHYCSDDVEYDPNCPICNPSLRR